MILIHFSLLCSLIAAELVVELGQFSFKRQDLISLVDKQNIQCKPEYNFVTTPVSPGSDEYEIKVAEKLKENLNQSNDSPKVILSLPTGRTIDNYVEFLFKEDLPGIINSLDDSRLDGYIARRLTEIKEQYAIKQLPNVSEKFVAPNVIELERMLHSSFRIAYSKIITGSTPLSNTNRIKNSLLFDILNYAGGVKAHVYIPKSSTIRGFLLSACSFQPSEMNFSDKVWDHVMTSLKRKDDPDTQKINLTTLVYSMNSLEIVRTYSNLQMDSWQRSMDSHFGRTHAKIPTGLSDSVSLSNCDKVYVEFGTLPYQSSTGSDEYIVREMIKRLLPFLNSTNLNFNFLMLISVLQTKEAQSVYKSTFIDKSAFSSIEISFQDVNEAVAKQMNLIKVPFFIGENNIILPPTDSKFTTKEDNGRILFEHSEFPHDKERLLSDDCILEKYVNFVSKKSLNPSERKGKLLKEFLKCLWASETVTEFTAQFTQLFDELFKKREQVEKERKEMRELREEEERKKEEERKRIEKERDEMVKKNHEEFKMLKEKKKSQNIVIGVIIVGLIIAMLVGAAIFNWSQQKKRKRRQNKRISNFTSRGQECYAAA